MSDDTKVAIIVSGIIVCLIVFLISSGIWISSVMCRTSWEDSGFYSRYKIMAGCQIKVDGRWIPEERYRTIED